MVQLRLATNTGQEEFRLDLGPADVAPLITMLNVARSEALKLQPDNTPEGC